MGSAVVAITTLSGCERRLFDVDLTIVEARTVAQDFNDVTISHSTVGDVGDENGGFNEKPFEFSDEATEVRFEVKYLDGDFSLVAFGRTRPFAVPDIGGVIPATVLMAPANEVGVLSTVPPALGGDACVADDGLGRVFLTGGSASSQAYVLDDRFDVLGLRGGFPDGVGGVGCAANAGVVAVTGGCTADAASTIVLIDLEGVQATIEPAALSEPCGAAAAPRSDGLVWLIDGDHRLTTVGNDGAVRANVAGPRAGVRRGFEVTAADAVVFILDGELHYADTTLVPLGSAIALGRHGSDVLVLDDDGLVASIENATTRPLAGVASIAEDDIAHFVVTDDGTFVGLSVDGTTLHVVGSVNAGGAVRTVSTTVTGATRVAALPGGTIVIGGANVAGLQTVAFTP